MQSNSALYLKMGNCSLFFFSLLKCNLVSYVCSVNLVDQVRRIEFKTTDAYYTFEFYKIVIDSEICSKNEESCLYKFSFDFGLLTSFDN